jgi:hypothetical protein
MMTFASLLDINLLILYLLNSGFYLFILLYIIEWKILKNINYNATK